MLGEKGKYKTGTWTWDERINALTFNSQETRCSAGTARSSKRLSNLSMNDVGFRDTLTTEEQLLFRKCLRRTVRPMETDIVLLQDIKDVALYNSKIEMLTLEFISYFHTKAMDAFLRSAIIYFQYYLQVWNNLQNRRVKAKKTLRHPQLIASENIIRDNLADLRSMLARDYAVLLTGLGDAKRFHHMSNENNMSLSDRDRKFFEVFIVLTERVVWIALKRKFSSLIGRELNRLLRSPSFSTMSKVPSMFRIEPVEIPILQGVNCKTERKLLQRSPIIQEIMFADHDYRMLSIGVCDKGSTNPRLEYLEIAYTAPEELLSKLNVGVGILGVPRRYLTDMLLPREISTTKKRDSTLKPIPEFLLPSDESLIKGKKVPECLPQKECKYQETHAITENRIKQHNLWMDYVKVNGKLKFQFEKLSPSYATVHSSTQAGERLSMNIN